MELLCPHCRHKFELEQAFQEVDGRKYVNLLTTIPPTLIRPLHNYVQLFTPAKQAMTWTKALRVLKELVPMIKEGQVKCNKATYTTPVKVWVAALTYLVETPPASLTLPLKGNGYLLSVLVAQAEKAQIVEAEQKEAAKQAEKDAANRALDAAKQAQAKALAKDQEVPKQVRPSPIPPEWAAKLKGMLNEAGANPLTPEQKAEHQRKLKQQIETAKANMSPEELEKLEAFRRERAESVQFPISTNKE